MDTPQSHRQRADIYTKDLISAWKGNLLFTTLKGRALWRIGLSSDGLRATSRENLFNGRFGRLRDVLVGPDGEVYLATSNRDGRGQPLAGRRPHPGRHAVNAFDERYGSTEDPVAEGHS